MINKKYIPFVALGILGFLDSLYLLISHMKPESVVCTGFNECDVVLTSSYAEIFSIPTAAFGVAYYIFIAIMFSILLENKNKGLERLALSFTVLGFAASVWFVYLQGFVINAWCLYCLLSALTSTVLFILAIYIYSADNKVLNN